MEDAREVLADWLKHNSPEFIPANLRALDGAAAPSSARTTDWYLANLAEARGLKWATLDRRANHPAVELVD